MTKSKEEYVYDGEWANDIQNGQGREIKNQKKYTGSFLNGNYHGYGLYVDSDLNQYDGEWASGLRSGIGHWTGSSGDQYKGEFFNGLFSGRGQFTFFNGDIYVGDFKDGKINGQGEYLYLNGETYKGSFKDGIPSGKGELKKNSGIKLSGCFENGEVFKESCCVYYEDGRVYKGSVDEKFRPHGRGVMELPSSNIIPGVWNHGQQEG